MTRSDHRAEAIAAAVANVDDVWLARSGRGRDDSAAHAVRTGSIAVHERPDVTSIEVDVVVGQGASALERARIVADAIDLTASDDAGQTAAVTVRIVSVSA